MILHAEQIHIKYYNNIRSHVIANTEGDKSAADYVGMLYYKMEENEQNKIVIEFYLEDNQSTYI